VTDPGAIENQEFNWYFNNTLLPVPVTQLPGGPGNEYTISVVLTAQDKAGAYHAVIKTNKGELATQKIRVGVFRPQVIFAVNGKCGVNANARCYPYVANAASAYYNTSQMTMGHLCYLFSGNNTTAQAVSGANVAAASSLNINSWTGADWLNDIFCSECNDLVLDKVTCSFTVN
jgi:hypothetical protein